MERGKRNNHNFIRFTAVFLYLISIILGCIFINHIGNNSHIYTIDNIVDNGYEILEPFKVEQTEDITAPAGVRTDYYFNLPSVRANYRDMIFHTSHQFARVYSDGQLIYNLSTEDSSTYKTSIGNIWNDVSFNQSSSTTIIQISIYPVYKEVIKSGITVYFGSKHDIVSSLMTLDIVTITLAAFICAIGLLFIIYSIYTLRNPLVDKNIFMLGMFSVSVGLWKIFDANSFLLLFPHSNIISTICFLALSWTVVPFAYYVKSLFSTRRSLIWYIPITAGIINGLSSLFLQIFHVLDLRQTLIGTHICFIFMIVVMLIMTIYEFKKKNPTRHLKFNITFIFLCLIGCIIDVVVYYNYSVLPAMIFGMSCFSAYIVYQGIYTIRATKAIMKKAAQAEDYRNMAFHDPMTGLLNRAAYARETEDINRAPTGTIMIAFDLNNLKYINDSMGHDIGDNYIKTAAYFIKDIFSDIGSCYRMGGDEFTVIVKSSTIEKCNNRIRVLKHHLAEESQNYPGSDFSIACGLMMYDPKKDYDISDTEKRADRMMYEDKFKTKAKSGRLT